MHPRQVSERIVSRALFLLSLPSQAERVSSQEQSKRRWSILAKLGGAGTMTKTTSQSYYLAEGGLDPAKTSHDVTFVVYIAERVLGKEAVILRESFSRVLVVLLAYGHVLINLYTVDNVLVQIRRIAFEIDALGDRWMAIIDACLFCFR